MAHSGTVTKAVIPVAGLGTRFLPATKVTPKVMMPVVDKPAIQYVVEEAVSAGLEDVLLITGEGQQSIADHFNRAYDLEARLTARGNQKALAQVSEPSELATVSYVRQDSPRGLGHAVLCAADHVGDEPFAVMLGDDLIDDRDDLLARMIAARQLYGGSIVALMEVPPDQISAYGCAAFKPTDDPEIVAMTDLIEKPDPSEAPSNWIVIGRYVCDPAIFPVLRHTPAGPRRRDPAHRRAADSRGRRPGHLRRRRGRARGTVPWAPVRYREQAGLPSDHGPVRVRAGPTWRLSSYPGSASTWTRCLRGGAAGRAGGGDADDFHAVGRQLSRARSSKRSRRCRPRTSRLTDADGTVLAADVTAAWPLPGFDNSAMDGYAVNAADVASASKDHPARLPVDAGSRRRRHAQPHADARPSDQDHDRRAAAGGRGRRHPGRVDRRRHRDCHDHAVRREGPRGQARPATTPGLGDLLLPAGTRLGPAQIGVLAAAGHGAILARRRPRVTVISTGNELAEPGSPLVPGLIWDSNSYMLAAAARQAGCEVIRHAVVRDDPAAVLAAIELAAATADLLITSGGVSMGGEHDVVKAALTMLGSVKFRKVAMQPGMPQGFGLLGSPPASRSSPCLGTLSPRWCRSACSSPPLSVPSKTFRLKLSRSARPKLSGPITSPAGRRSFLRGIHDRQAGVVEPLTGQGSHQIASAARANVLIVIPEQETSLPAGAPVDILDLP